LLLSPCLYSQSVYSFLSSIYSRRIKVITHYLAFSLLNFQTSLWLLATVS
jgi:hypothetical protein